MKHFVLFRFQPEVLSEELLYCFIGAFDALKQELPKDIIYVKVHRNCIGRDTNMDIMVEMDLASQASLDTYLTHPIHLDLVKKVSSYINSRCSFDYAKGAESQ